MSNKCPECGSFLGVTRTSDDQWNCASCKYRWPVTEVVDDKDAMLASLGDASSSTLPPDSMVLVTPEERARAKAEALGRGYSMGKAALLASLICAAGSEFSYSNTCSDGPPPFNYDSDVATKLQEERRLRKAANFAKRQPKGNK